MKKLLITALVATSLTTSSCFAEEKNGNLVVKVNGEGVYDGEINEALSNLVGKEGEKLLFSDLPNDKQRFVIQQIINNKVVIQKATKAGYEDDDEVQKAVEAAKKEFIKAKYLKDTIKKEMTEDKLRKLYDDLESKTKPIEEVQASHILVESKKEADKVYKKAVKGDNFAELAEKYSTGPSATKGGDLGWFSKNKMVPEFSDKAFSMEAGDISKPVKTEFGWHVIKVTGKRVKPVPSFKESREILEKKFMQDKSTEIVKKLREKASISYGEKYQGLK